MQSNWHSNDRSNKLAGQFGAGDLSGVRTVRDSPQRRQGASAVRIVVAVLAVIAAATLTIGTHGRHAPPLAAAAPSVAPHWVARTETAAKTDEWFTLQAAALADLPHSYEIHREDADPGREDILIFGTPDAETAYLRLEIRRSQQVSADPSLFVALVRRAAEASLAVSHAGQPFTVPTRLGAFEASEVTLSGNGRQRECLGLRLYSTDTRLRILSLACGAGGKAVEPAAAACFMDWLGLKVDAYDPVLKNFFAEADRRRGSACKAPRSIDDALRASAPENDLRGNHRHSRKRATTAGL